MITIINPKRYKTDLAGEEYWTLILVIPDGEMTWYYPATAPGDVPKGDLLAHFAPREAHLLQNAKRRGYSDLFKFLPDVDRTSALSAILFDELNRLRIKAGEPEMDWNKAIVDKVSVVT